MKAAISKSLFTTFFILLIAGISTAYGYNPVRQSELSNLCVRAIVKDSYGYIWIATANGLCKSYGNEYEIYFGEIDDHGTVPSNSVTNLYTDKDGWLLVATNLGVCGLKKDTKTFHRFLPENDSYSFCAFGFVEFSDRLFCYGARGLYEIDKAKGSLKHCVTVEGEEVSSATVGPDGLLWISNGTCMMGIDSSLQPVTRLKFAASDRVNTMSSTDKDLLLGTPHGLVRFNPADQSMKPSVIGRDIEVKHILAVDDSTHLVATGNRGVVAYNNKLNTVSSEYHNVNFKELPSAEINNVFCDNEKNVWVSTFDKGEVMLSDRPKLFNLNRNRVDVFRNDFVTRATYDKHGNLWVGTRSNGIGELDKETTRLRYFNSRTSNSLDTYSHDFVQELFFDSQGRLWAGYNNSLIVCKPEYTPQGKASGLKVIKTFQSFVNVVSIAEDNLGQLWVGTSDNGLLVFDNNLNPVKNFAAPVINSNNITKIIPYDNRHVLLSAYTDDLYLVDIHNLSIRHFDLSNQLARANTIDMLLDKDKNLWLGTYHHGLFRVDAKTNEITRCIENRPYYDIVGLAQDREGDIWASSSFGMYHFSNDGRLMGSYLKANGLGSNQFHEKCVATRPDGTMLFGGNAGIEEVVPTAADISKLPRIDLITKKLLLLPGYTPALKDDMADVDEASVSELTLNHKENSLNIEFFGLNYDKSSNIEYAYMLEGLDKDFIYSGTYNNASYSNLASGNYNFYVRARYKGKQWQEPEKLLSLTVKPNPWFSTTANIIYALLILTAIIAGNRIYLRIRLIKQKYALSEERIKQEKNLTANRIHFFTNISHELRTPLTLICGPAKHLRDNYKSMSEAQIKESFDFIDSNIERLLTLINQLLSFRRVNSETLPLQVSRNDLGAQLEALSKLYTFYATENRVTIKLEKPSDERIMLTYDSDKIEKIISNLIVNAVKYSNDEDGNVTMRLEILKHPEGFDHDNDYTYASISITDNGRGMNEEDIPLIFQPFKRLLGINDQKKTEGFGIGLHFVAHLIKVHKGIIKTVKNPEGGMTFTIIFPACDEAFTEEEFRNINHDITEPYIGPDVDDTEPEIESEDVDDCNACEGEENRPKVLVVEDNASLNAFVSGLFSEKYQVIQASDGQEGLKLAAEECPDVIISDVKMPGDIDGYALCRQIKSDPSTSHISVVLLTAKTLDENKIEGYKCGADAYLCKPFSPDVLIACVNNLMSKRLQQASLILASAGLSDQPAAQPNMVQEMSPLDKKFLEKLYAYIENNLDNCDLNVNMLGRELGFSRTNFYRKVKALTGISPTDLLRVYRLNCAAELLLTREYTVGEVGEKIGFGSQSHFSSLFKKHFGVSPRAYVTNHFSQYCAEA